MTRRDWQKDKDRHTARRIARERIEEADAETPTFFNNRAGRTCAVCKKPIEMGTVIHWRPPNHVWHARSEDCPEMEDQP